MAVAWNVVEELSATEAVRPGEANAAAPPVAATALVQEELVYSLTVEPASAEPVTSGKLSFAGEAGEVASDEGAAGALESSMYATPLEQPDTLPAASVAVA